MNLINSKKDAITGLIESNLHQKLQYIPSKLPDMSIKNISQTFPKIDARFFEYKGFNEYRTNITFFSKEILLGTTNYSIEEIINYENKMKKKGTDIF